MNLKNAFQCLRKRRGRSRAVLAGGKGNTEFLSTVISGAFLRLNGLGR